MKQSTKKLFASAALVAALGAACGNDNGNDDASGNGNTTTTEQSSSSTMAADTGVTSPASTLRATLTAGLQEHVYLAGIAISSAVGAGGNMQDPAVMSAVQTLDGNSVALSEAIGSVYGDEAASQFLALWRTHIGFFVDYTLGKATGDQAKADEAKSKLDGYRTEFGAFIDSASDGKLPSDAVAAELGTHVNSLIAAIDAVVAKSPDAFPKLQAAAAHMPMTADTLAGGIAAQMPDTFGS
jgi:hypothetical protein